MPSINYKVELKLKWTKYCILSAAGNENDINDKVNINNFIFSIKDKKKTCSCCNFISNRQPKFIKAF